MKRKFFILNISFILLTLVSTPFIHAQQQHRNSHQSQNEEAKLFTLKGKVVDWDYNYVKNAIVLIPEISKSVETDESGSFKIIQIPQGKYHVEVYAEGFLDYFSDVFSLEENKLNYQIV